MEFDILIRDGTVVDGTGAKPFQADIAVNGLRILDMGRLAHARAARTIDARGMIVSPGFIDIHGHSDISLLVSPRAESKVMQGVTSEISGNCGESAGPISEKTIDDWRAVGHRLGVTVDWRSLGGFLDRLKDSISINYGTLVGLGTVRGAVMGSVDRRAGPAELSGMKSLVEESLEQGALGVSTGLVYPPGMYAPTEEISELTACASRGRGLYATHMRSEGDEISQAVDEALEISEQAQVPLQISHFKTVGKKNWGRMPELLRKLERAADEGVDVKADRYPYTASATGLTSLLPRWAHQGGRKELLDRLRNEEDCNRMREAAEGRIEEIGWENILITNTWTASGRSLEGKSLAESASERRVEPFDLMVEIALQSGGLASIVAFSQDEDDMLLTLSHPLVMLASDSGIRSVSGVLSEGKPHPRAYGAFPAFYRIFVRQKGLLTIEKAVHKMTGMPAQRLGLAQRGILRKGYWADIVVLDSERFEDTATYGNPHSYARGLEYVIVNGEIAVERGLQTDSRSGLVLRGGV
jgi:N-acyl-D-amino-acid deacylase